MTILIVAARCAMVDFVFGPLALCPGAADAQVVRWLPEP